MDAALLGTVELSCCENESWVTLALFRRVKNAGRLRGDVTSGKIQAALLEPTLVSAHYLLDCPFFACWVSHLNSTAWE